MARDLMKSAGFGVIPYLVRQVSLALGIPEGEAADMLGGLREPD